MWTKIKGFFAWLWLKIKLGGKWIVGGIIALAVIITGIFALSKEESSRKDNSDKRPEIAQVFEPSIGTPLPPDTNPEQGGVGGTQTSEPSDSPTTTEQESSGYVAPPTGVDDDIPFTYKSEEFNFSVNLAGGTQVDEQNEGVRFTTKPGKVLISVVVVESKNETATNIINQLKNSVGTTSLTETKFSSLPAVSFSQNGENGLVVITKDKVYYLTGDQSYFKNISL